MAKRTARSATNHGSITSQAYQPSREHYLRMARMHLSAAEFFRTQGPKHRADMESAYRLADDATTRAEGVTL